MNQGREAEPDGVARAEKIAVVTGASAGIGAAIAARFVAEGVRVFGLARRPCAVAGVQSLEVDLAEPAAINRVLRQLLEALPSTAELHLVHNAAVMPRDSVLGFDRARVERALRINLIAPMHLSSALIPRMAPGSSILYIGSTLSEKAVPGRMTYVTSKHGLVGLMRATVQDLFGRAIHSACICPGFTDTAMLRPLLDADPEFRESVLRLVSFGRLVEPEEIADLVIVVARSPALNGALLHANLGQREA